MTPHLKPKAKAVLDALIDAGAEGVTTHQLCQPDVGGIRFGARIHEIRDAGYLVHERRLRAGSSLYTLVAAAELAA